MKDMHNPGKLLPWELPETSYLMRDEHPDQVSLMRWTTERYHRAIEAGIFDKYDRIELVNGQIWRKCNRSPHGCAVESALRDFFNERFSSDKYHMDSIGQLSLPPYTSCEPDFKVFDRQESGEYEWPDASSTRLVVEVVESNTIHRDGLKAAVYAGAGIPECWMVDLTNNSLSVMTKPDKNTCSYRSVVSYTLTEIAQSDFAGVVLVKLILLI